MPIHNSVVAEIFKEIADLLAIETANQFRVQAFRNAARTIEPLSRPVADLVEAGEDLTKLDGIGEDMAGKIQEIVKTSDLYQLEKLRARTPSELKDMLKLDGLGPKRVQKIYEELDITDLDDLEQAAENEKIRKLAGLGPKTEQKILEDLHRTDNQDDILQALDLTIGSVHTQFDLPPDRQTERIIRAMDNPYFNILAHPTGRRIGKRPPYQVDMERLMQAALERGCFLEVNPQPSRLDLKDIYIKMAKELGLKLAISTDAHRASELKRIRFGVDQARRGWLSAGDVLNARPWEDLKALLKR